jgi:two-component system, sensor histidine kinase
MGFSFRWKPLKDVSISSKLYFVVGTMAVLIALELLTLWFAIHTLSSVRALVGAEGLWSKAQKDAVYQLEKYYRTKNENDYMLYRKFMEVPMGDHKTRLELMKKNPDLGVARQGFLEGRNHTGDVDGMITLLQRFSSVSYIDHAVSTWSKGDSVIESLSVIGEQIHKELNSGAPSSQRLEELIAALDPVNVQLTALEDEFSFTLGEGSRWLENLILELVFIVALTVEITGLVLGFSVSRGITKGLNEINRATGKIKKGDFNERAAVFSHDEIGQVAMSVNEMTQQLVRSNLELGQFAHVASHDLQEPLRKIQSFGERITAKDGDKLSAETKDYFLRMKNAANRMQVLIDNLLSYSRINKSEINLQKVDLNQLLSRTKEELQDVIEEKKALIMHDRLPVLMVTEFQFQQLFSNLLSNSIKYQVAGKIPEVKITYEKIRAQSDGAVDAVNGQVGFHKICVTDNGIGFEQEYAERIFGLFQRLHGRSEYTGTGIGLTICRKIVQNHNGFITATGKPGQGSTFEILVPETAS